MSSTVEPPALALDRAEETLPGGADAQRVAALPAGGGTGWEREARHTGEFPRHASRGSLTPLVQEVEQRDGALKIRLSSFR